MNNAAAERDSPMGIIYLVSGDSLSRGGDGCKRVLPGSCRLRGPQAGHLRFGHLSLRDPAFSIQFKDLDEIVVPVQSASVRVAIGIAKKGALISRDVFRKKLQSLEAKGFLCVLGKEYRGTRIRPLLPREVSGIVVLPAAVPQTHIESMDFFSDPENREAIFAREGQKCFYCLASLNDRNRVIDHVVPKAERDNSYRNCVGACLNCNSEKCDSVGEDFLRTLYRKGRLRAEELDSRLQLLSRIRDGCEKPAFASAMEIGGPLA